MNQRGRESGARRRWMVVIGATALLTGAAFVAKEVGARDYAQDSSGGGLASGTGGNSDSCYSMQAPPLLDWPTSAIWRNDQIVFADVLEKALLSIEPKTNTFIGIQREFHGPASVGQSQPQDLSHIREIPGGGGYLVEDEGDSNGDGDRLLRLDSDMTVVGALQVDGRPLSDGWELDVLYDWQPAVVANTLGVLAFADIKRGDGDNEWDSALVYFDETGTSSIFDRFDVQSDVSYQSTQEEDYIAVTGETGFMLVYEAEPYLLQVDLTSGEQASSQLVEIPADFRSRPVVQQTSIWLAADRGPEKLSAHLEVVEQSSGAAGLFARGDKLFLIGREAEKLGTTWTLVELDTDGSELARSPIPVSEDTRHLTLAVGSGSSVGFLEKGGVERIGPGRWNAPYLEMKEIVVVPADWIDDLNSGIMSSTSSCD